MTQRWTYLGPEGTFTEQAARSVRDAQVDPAGIELVPADGVPAAVAALRAGEVDAACVPLESSVEGSVPLVLDELTHGEPLLIAAEGFVRITFDLLVRPGFTIDQIRTVGSHPHGHAQVRSWLAAHLPGVEGAVTNSTAAAAEAVAAGSIDAAAAGPVAGERHGLESLATDIGDVRDAVTRFVLVTRPGPVGPATGNDRTSLVVFVDNEPGSLLAVLGELADRGINLTRLESRPARSRLGEYFFLLDADGHIDEPAMSDAVAALHRRAADLRFLGSYPRATGHNPPVPRYGTVAAYAAAEEFMADIRLGRAGAVR